MQAMREIDRKSALVRTRGCRKSRIECLKFLRVSVSESATAFSLTCAGEPASGIATTLPLRTAQASATAAAEQPCAAPICASVRSVIKGYSRRRVENTP